MNARKKILTILAVLAVLNLCVAVGTLIYVQTVLVPEEVSREQVQIVSETPLPTPAPTPAPVVSEGKVICFEGRDFPTYDVDGVQSVKTRDALERLGVDAGPGEEFIWRKDTICLPDEYTPLTRLCSDMRLGSLYDSENDLLYVTASAGDWDIPLGYDVAVFMYHAVGTASDEANLFVTKYEFQKQVDYLLENGYTPIWFEDLWRVDEIRKPVILVFDDGWWNNYTNVFPIIKENNVKITVAAVPDFIDHTTIHLTSDQVKEMNDSGLVRFESHSMTHNDLDTLDEDTQRWELEQSKLEITRLTGIIPVAMIYPSGTQTEFIRDTLINGEHIYKFGVMMFRDFWDNYAYNTSEDPALVYRFFPQRNTSINEYAYWLTSTFGPETDETAPAE